MTPFIAVLLLLASISIGLRLTSLFLSERVHPMVRLMVALLLGVLASAVILNVCTSYGVFDMGLGLLLSLSVVGPYDLAKWWFRRRLTRGPPDG